MGKYILIVDDVSTNRKLLRSIIGKHMKDAQVLEADGGEVMYRILKTAEIGLIILDIMMPGKDGIQILEELKSDDRYRDIPVIVCSAISQVETIEKAISLGAYDYFSKPLTEVQMRISFPLQVKNALGSFLKERQLMELSEQVKSGRHVFHQMHKRGISELDRIQGVRIHGNFNTLGERDGNLLWVREIEGKVYFVAAEVFGEGISGAMISSVIYAALNTLVEFTAPTPDQILLHLNQLLYAMYGGTGDGYAGAFAGVIHDSSFHYSNAGHSYPVFYPMKETGVCLLKPDGMPLGTKQDANYEYCSRNICQNDLIILYSHGLNERSAESCITIGETVLDYCRTNIGQISLDIEGFIGHLLNDLKEHNHFKNKAIMVAVQR